MGGLYILMVVVHPVISNCRCNATTVLPVCLSVILRIVEGPSGVVSHYWLLECKEARGSKYL